MNLKPVSTICGVKFFNSASECIAHFKQKHWSKKVISLIKSYGTLFTHALNRMNLIIQGVDSKMESFVNPKLTKKRLIVCIHGLNNNPTQFKTVVEELKTKDLSDTDIFIPRVLQKGNATLDEMVQPIFKSIQERTQISDDVEIFLVGVSNGARIARALETEIAQSNYIKKIKKLHFISIVGACKGSALANFANRIGLSWVMSKNISKEMPVGSARNKRLDQEWNAAFNNPLAREYTFIGSPHDWQVTNDDSYFMRIDRKKARYAFVPGHGHNSIVNAVAKTVAKLIAS